MKFGPVQTATAEGAVLAHSLTAGPNRLRKGKTLDADDVAALLEAGHQEVIVARSDPGDLAEDVAAARLAEAICGAGLRASGAATGRVNLYATGPGVVQINVMAVEAFNALNPMITVATVPQLFRVSEGDMVATIKIISYAVPEDDVGQVCDVATDALSVLPPTLKTATLIETQISDAPSAKGREALAGRLARLDVALGARVIVSHSQAAVADALRVATGEVIFVLTASATSDADDVGPAALRAAGGTLTQFGMPVDPGNLLFLGFLGAKPVIGLPGCARSPALNGADWVLERVICGVSPTPADFAKMGVGGLLKEIPTRPQPRADI